MDMSDDDEPLDVGFDDGEDLGQWTVDTYQSRPLEGAAAAQLVCIP